MEKLKISFRVETADLSKAIPLLTDTIEQNICYDFYLGDVFYGSLNHSGLVYLMRLTNYAMEENHDRLRVGIRGGSLSIPNSRFLEFYNKLRSRL